MSKQSYQDSKRKLKKLDLLWNKDLSEEKKNKKRTQEIDTGVCLTKTDKN